MTYPHALIELLHRQLDSLRQKNERLEAELAQLLAAARELDALLEDWQSTPEMKRVLARYEEKGAVRDEG